MCWLATRPTRSTGSTKCTWRESVHRGRRAWRPYATRVDRPPVSGATAAGASDRAFGPELVWFPDPIGARECQLVREGVTVDGHDCAHCAPRHRPLRRAAFVASDRGALPARPARRGLGCDARGGHGRARRRRGESIVYGVVDRMPVVAGTVLAVAAVHARGTRRTVTRRRRVGVRALGEVVTPVPFLAELARRGVKAAAFDGVAPAA